MTPEFSETYSSGARILRSGPRTLIQDAGRWGFQHQGLSVGGAADQHSFVWANALLGNQDSDACLEITLGGLWLQALVPLDLALTGADCRATADGEHLAPWQRFRLNSGQTLRLLAPERGLLSYLAVAGGWQTPAFCGSRSVVAREKLPGLAVLTAGDTLPVPARTSGRNTPGSAPPAAIPDFGGPVTLGLLPGPQFEMFSQDDRRTLVNCPWRIQPESDRMGYRLQGPAMTSGPDGIVSEGIVPGAVQVTGSGQPVVMLRDRQTIGGYPKIATVAAVDCDRLAQCRPGETVRFRWTDIDTCLSALRRRQQLLDIF